MRSVRDIQTSIVTEANACVERKKDSKFLNGFFVSRQSLRGECIAEATKKYQAELNEAQAIEYGIQSQVNNAFLGELTDGGLSEQQLGIIAIVALIVLILFFLLMKRK